MDLDFLIWACVGVIVGVAIGVVVTQKIYKSKIIGNLRVDRSIEDDSPYLFLEITKGNIDKFRNEKYVMLQVLNESYISHD